MDILWSPWRYDYISSSGGKSEKTPEINDCVFCRILESPASDEEKFILHRAGFNFVILNVYPYTSGHLMIVPYAHLAEIDRAEKAATDEMMDLAKQCQTALRAEYQPDGFNFGMNLGKAAGAGVAEHYHLHALPRWSGDVNFMTAVGETRTIPETLKQTYHKLKPHFN